MLQRLAETAQFIPAVLVALRSGSSKLSGGKHKLLSQGKKDPDEV